METEALTGILAKELCDSVEGITKIGGGANSRVYRVLCRNGGKFAVKEYFRNQADSRNRLETEFSSLEFLRRNAITAVPEPIAAFPDRDIAIYEYVEGELIDAQDADADDVLDLIGFLASLQRLTDASGSDRIAPASEATFSFAEIVDNLQTRWDRFEMLSRGEDVDRQAEKFLTGELERFLQNTLNELTEHLLDMDMGYEEQLSKRFRTLSPSDFGFHNAVRRGKEIVFLDFEYFGWDDPAKTVVDFVLHPGMRLSEDRKRQFVERFLTEFSHDTQLKSRVRLSYPLYGVKWCLILLNEFLPADLARRKFSGKVESAGERKEIQLEKSVNMLKRIRDDEPHFPYF